MATVSAHGMKRLKQRVGVPPRAALRRVELVLERGQVAEDVKGRLGVILRAKELATHAKVRVWCGYAYLFDGEALITVYSIKGLLDEKKPKEAEPRAPRVRDCCWEPSD